MIKLHKEKSILVFACLLVLYETMCYLSNDMYLPALPALAKDFYINAHLAQMTITAWFLGAVSLHLFVGLLSDRIGRRPVLLGGGVLFVLSTGYCAVALHIVPFLVARLFQGAATCVIGTAGYASIHESFDQKQAIRLLAIMGSITILAPALGPLAGSIFLYWVGWRWLFVGLSVIAVINIAFLWRWMPETNPPERRYVLSWKKTIENYQAIFFNPHFTLNMFIFCFTFGGVLAWIVAGPFLVIHQFQKTALMFGFIQMMIFSSIMLGSQIVRYGVQKIKPDRLIQWGLLTSLIGGVMAVALSWLFPHSLMGSVFSLMVFALGSSITFGPAQQIAIEACTEPMGARMAAAATLTSLSGFLSGAWVSATYSGTLFSIAILLFFMVIAACGCYVWQRYKR